MFHLQIMNIAKKAGSLSRKTGLKFEIYITDILKNNTISGSKIYPYVMDKNDTIDIDTKEDWVKAENLVK